MPRFDLHCHSTCSDGLLSPSEVVRRAASRGVEVLALTDHDEVAGLSEAASAARESRIRFVPGAEISVSWEDTTLHVVALGIDAGHPVLVEGLRGIREGRDARARRIGEALAKAGIPGAFEGALHYATRDRLVSRTHFARYLVAQGHARDVREVFKRYLTRGKPGHVRHAWASLPEAIGWIRAAGGQAVLAHPGRYVLGSEPMRRLLGQFRDLGGEAIEILSSSHTPVQAARFAALARVFALAGSIGSDWHGPGESRFDFGELAELPAGVTPVWSAW